MGKAVYVVTNPEFGWDCVVGVYFSKDQAEKWEEKSEMYIVHEQEIADDEEFKD